MFTLMWNHGPRPCAGWPSFVIRTGTRSRYIKEIRNEQQMNSALLRMLYPALALLLLCGCDQRGKSSRPTESQSSVLAMRVIPDGNYLVNLRPAGRSVVLNLEVADNSAHCVASSEAEMEGL